MLTQSKITQEQMTPAQALEMLKEGNARFVEGKMTNRDLNEQVTVTGQGQFPFGIVLHCIDSRVSAELLFDQGIGDLFSARVAGNFVNDDILGSMEFACKVAGSKLIMVLGHTKCGAIKGACNKVELGNLTTTLSKIKPALEAVEEPVENRNGDNADFVKRVTDANVELTMEKIKTDSPVLNEMITNGEIDLVGGIYNVDTGSVDFWS